jgi:hypothetical protein
LTIASLQRYFGGMWKSIKTTKLAWCNFYLAVLLAISTRLIGFLNYTEFYGDQVRDQYVIESIWKSILSGNWSELIIHLGPQSSIGGYSLPPLYYYLASIPTIVDFNNPSLSIISNTICSLLSIILGSIVVYRIIPMVTPKFRLLASSIFALLWSVFEIDVYLNSQEWNPSSVNCFLFAFILISSESWNMADVQKLDWRRWLLKGFLLAILVSLHSSTLLILPLFFVIYSIVYTYKFKNVFPPILTIVSLAVFLTPYWLGEISTNWRNSQSIVNTILTKNSEISSSLLPRLDNAIASFVWLANEAYFVDLKAGLVYLVLFIFSVIYLFQKRRYFNFSLIIIYTSIVLLFLVAISSYKETLYTHYFVVIWSLGFFVPLLAWLFSLIDYLELPKTRNKLKWKNLEFARLLLLSSFLLIILLSNLVYTFRFLNLKIGEKRLANTNDLIQVARLILDNSTLCVDKMNLPALQYFVRNSNNIKVVKYDKQKCLYWLHFKYISKNMRRIANPSPDFNPKQKIIFQNQAVELYTY